MAYQPLKLDPGLPPHVTKLIRSRVESYFRDVHTMLRLPLPDNDLLAGCNFAITQILTSVVGGVSATLYGEKGHKGRLFKEVLRKFYPWSLESANPVKPGRGAEIIYTLFRNPLTHELGLDPPNKPVGQKIIVKRLSSENKTKGLPEKTIEQIETDANLVTRTATITIDSVETLLLVERFYWGVRTMIENLSRDSIRMHQAELSLMSRFFRVTNRLPAPTNVTDEPE